MGSTFNDVMKQQNDEFNAPHRYSVEPHGDGYAVYFGRNRTRHGYNLGRLTEISEENAKLIEQGLNMALDARRADSSGMPVKREG